MEISHSNLWRNRTRHFWLGLMVFVTLVAWMMIGYFREIGIAYETRFSSPHGSATITGLNVSNGALSLSRGPKLVGGITITTGSGEWPLRLPTPAFPKWRFTNQASTSYRILILPDLSYKRCICIKFPLWIIVVLWGLTWLWWMRHADLKEEQIFGYRPVKE